MWQQKDQKKYLTSRIINLTNFKIYKKIAVLHKSVVSKFYLEVYFLHLLLNKINSTGFIHISIIVYLDDCIWEK